MNFLIRQRQENEALPRFRQRLADADPTTADAAWIRLPERDEWLERYEAARERAVRDPKQLVVRSSLTRDELARETRALRPFIDGEVVAIPRGVDEVGCVQLSADRFAAWALPLLDADRDDVSVVSTNSDDGAHLTIYEWRGQLEHEIQVWGARWTMAFRS
jgi:hypothetical protein